MELELQEPGPGTRGTVAQLPAQSKAASEITLVSKAAVIGYKNTVLPCPDSSRLNSQGGKLQVWRKSVVLEQDAS